MDIYVSREGGDDRNPGTSESKPIRSTAALARRLVPGSVARLRRGERHDWFTVHASEVTIAAYGQGPRPIISGGKGLVIEGNDCKINNVDAEACHNGFWFYRGSGVIQNCAARRCNTGFAIDAGGWLKLGYNLLATESTMGRIPGTNSSGGAGDGIQIAQGAAALIHKIERAQLFRNQAFGLNAKVGTCMARLIESYENQCGVVAQNDLDLLMLDDSIVRHNNWTRDGKGNGVGNASVENHATLWARRTAFLHPNPASGQVNVHIYMSQDGWSFIAEDCKFEGAPEIRHVLIRSGAAKGYVLIRPALSGRNGIVRANAPAAEVR
jgi:hypothetical protein